MMKDVTEYIVYCRKGVKCFWVDNYDIESGERVFEDKERFKFVYRKKKYEGCAVNNGEEMSPIYLVD